MFADWHFPFKECTILPLFSSSSVSTPDYYLNSAPIPSSINHNKDLGRIFSTNLSWSFHTSPLLISSLGSWGASNSIFTKKSLYIALIRFRIMYASLVWRPHLSKDIKLLERIWHATKSLLNLLPLIMTFEISDILDLFFVHTYPPSTKQLWHYNLAKIYFILNPSIQPLECPFSTQPVPYAGHSEETNQAFLNHFLTYFNPDNPWCTFHIVRPCNACTSLPLRTNFNPLRQPV